MDHPFDETTILDGSLPVVFDEPVKVSPLDLQFGDVAKRTVPAELDGLLFGDAMNVFAIIDSAKILGLPETLAASSLAYSCLYSGGAAEDLSDVAPYIVQLDPASDLTRRLFMDADQPIGWWRNRAAVFIRSPSPMDEVRKHFRKYTRLQSEDGNWALLRFWEADTMLSLIRNSTPIDQQKYAALDHEFCVIRSSADGDEWLCMRTSR